MKDDAFVDDDMEPDPELNRLTNMIIGAAIEVHRHLGPGHLESAYEEALAIEFDLRNIPFERQQAVHLKYKGQEVGKGRLDFLVFGKIILDTKAVESLCATHSAQMISYLRVAGLKLGLIINFNVRVLKDGIRRIAN